MIELSSANVYQMFGNLIIKVKTQRITIAWTGTSSER